jgi:hypothetical protein
LTTIAPSVDFTLTELEKAFNSLGLTLSKNLEDLQAANEIGKYLPQCRVEFAEHFDPLAQYLIYDPPSGTLGLVYDVRMLSQEKATSALAELKKMVESAIYVRHLLVQAQYRQKRKQRSILVELVLLSSGPNEGHTQGNLRALIRKGELLDAIHGIGINLLHAKDGASPLFPQDSLRRAFPWLLRACKKWYEKVPPRVDIGRFKGIKLENYRLSGIRKLEVACDAAVHLVFGANGTGKSSIAEALELAFCGSAERLRDQLLSKAIKFDQKSRAMVSVDLADAKPHRIEIPEAKSLESSLEEKWPVARFRLDQSLMDRLTNPWNRADRARTFLGAYFPEDRDQLEEHATLVEAADRAYKELPPHRLNFNYTGDVEVDAKNVAVHFGWLAAADNTVPDSTEAAEACLPLPISDLQQLAPLDESLKATLELWKKGIPSAALVQTLAAEIDQALIRLISSFVAPYPNAMIALEKTRHWHVESSAEAKGSFIEALNSWLEHHALADIGKKALEVSRTVGAIHSAQALGKSDLLLRFLLPEGQQKNLEQAIDRWSSKEISSFEQVMSFKQHSPFREGETSQRSLSVLELDEIAALNSVGNVLGFAELGNKINRALASDRTVNVESTTGRATVVAGGESGWANGLLAELEPFREICARLQSFDSLSGSWIGQQRIQRFKDALAKEAARKKGTENLTSVLFSKFLEDRTLAEALNELLALFTPARWAYTDIDFSFKAASGAKSEIGFETGGYPIDLRLNTAELNLFTVALFLLCAPRRQNKLGLLVLDDPLQNMDELTVTTFARGLARLIRLPSWPKGWQLLILLHGEDDLERLRQELPAAVYRLHWQSPLEKGPLDPILMDPRESTHRAEQQKLSQILVSSKRSLRSRKTSAKDRTSDDSKR